MVCQDRLETTIRKLNKLSVVFSYHAGTTERCTAMRAAIQATRPRQMSWHARRYSAAWRRKVRCVTAFQNVARAASHRSPVPDLRAVACSTAWGATDPGASRAARAYALELGVDGGHDTTCSLRTPDRVEERLAEIKADNTWSIKGRSCTGLAALERHAVASTPGANLLITLWIRRACVRG